LVLEEDLVLTSDNGITHITQDEATPALDRYESLPQRASGR
jgi:hypothetical protein